MSKNGFSKIFCIFFISALIVSSNVAVASATAPWTSNHRDSGGLQSSLSGVNHADGVQGGKASLDWSVESLDSYVDDQNTVEIIVGVDNSATNKNHIASLASQSGGQVVDTINMGDKASVVVKVSVSSAFGFVDKVHNSGVSNYVEPNGEYNIDSAPNDPSWREQWGPQRMNVDDAWDTIGGSATLLVAVIDTGIDYTHPDLANYVPLGYDFVNDDADPKDDNGHGTHCAGVIAATINNSIGVAGTANVQIMAEKGLNAAGSGSHSALAQCIVHATDAGVDILSNSWGGSAQSDTIADAIEYATSHGALFIASAGNSDTDQYSYPAAYENAVAVAAIDSSDKKASFSNYGSWVDVTAPGVGIYSTMPTYTVYLNTQYGVPQNYSNLSGTSMACPGVAGVAALIWSQYPTMTAAFVRQQLESTCDDIGAAGFDNIFGYGVVDAQCGVEEAPVEHDLAAQSWVKPSYVMLGVAQSFNLTTINRGSANESNVQVGIFVNGSAVDSAVIPSLAAYRDDSNVLTWTPPALGTYNVTWAVAPAAGETNLDNNRLTVFYQVIADPSAESWTQIASYIDYNYSCNMKAAYSQLQDDVVYFKMNYYHNWSSVTQDINTGIMIDVDRNISTGMPQEYYPGQNDFIGSDFMILVGNEGTEIWRWDYDTRRWGISNPINILYLYAPNNSATFVVGVSAADLETDGVFDCSFNDIFDYYNPSDSTWYSAWYWMPTAGYVPFVAQLSKHDLVVTLEVPRIWTPQTACNLTAKVFNFAQSNEADVNLVMYVDGAVVANLNFDNIASGAYEKISIITSPDTGFFNITAYAEPKAEEVNVDNNVRTRIAPVSPKIAVISENDELWTTLNILDSMNVNYDYGNNNYQNLYTQYLLTNYPVVIYYNDGRNISATEQLALNLYLADGGNLLVTGHDALYYPDAKLANVLRVTTSGDDLSSGDLIVVAASHPIVNNGYGVFEGFEITELGKDNDAVEADTARNAITVAEMSSGFDKIVATDSLPGKAVFWNGIGSNDWIENSYCQAMFKNTMLWFLDTTAPATTDDYDAQWHASDFTINLSAQDYFGVAQTSYKVNDGETKTVAAHGQPQITTDSSDNTLEYWSVDISGNEEIHHTLSNIQLDKTAPEGSVQIDGGNTYATSTSVTLTLTASNTTSGVSQVRYSNDGIWDTETWETYLATKSWTLPSGDGEKTVYYQVQNNAGLTSVFSDTIILDTTNPSGSVSINGGDSYATSATVELTISDANSGAAQMRFSNDDTAWGTWQTYATTAAWTLEGADGTKTVYVQFKDSAGLTSQTYSDTIILDTLPPSGSISINGDGADGYTTSTDVTLHLYISNTNPFTAMMRFSNNNADWSSWETFLATADWTLTSGEGTKTVYAQFKDEAGLISSTYSATVILDTTNPTGSIEIDSGAEYSNQRDVTLTLSILDANSGSAKMRLSNDNTQWTSWEIYSTSKPWLLSDGDGVKTVYVQYMDNAWLTSQVYSDSIILDTTPPTGSISINNGDEYTKTNDVILLVTLNDANSGSATVHLSRDNSTWVLCTEDLASIPWSLNPSDATVDGQYTVYVKLADNAGLSSYYSDSIILDTTAPTANAGSSRTVTVGTGVSFNGGASSDNYGIDSYAWTFGDSSVGTGSTTSHTYTGTGTYTVTLTVTDVAGNTAETTITVTVQAAPASTPSPTTKPTATPAPTSTPTASPTPTPAPEPLNVTKTDGTTTTQITVSGGNITASQISNAKIQVNETAQTTTLSFTITGESGTTGFGNITIPKSQVPTGTMPTILIDGLLVDSQGFTQDAENYYVWYTTHFSTHDVSIVFKAAPPTQATDNTLTILGVVTAVVVLAAIAGVLVLRRRKTRA